MTLLVGVGGSASYWALAFANRLVSPVLSATAATQGRATLATISCARFSPINSNRRLLRQAAQCEMVLPEFVTQPQQDLCRITAALNRAEQRVEQTGVFFQQCHRRPQSALRMIGGADAGLAPGIGWQDPVEKFRAPFPPTAPEPFQVKPTCGIARCRARGGQQVGDAVHQRPDVRAVDLQLGQWQPFARASGTALCWPCKPSASIQPS